MGLFSHRPEEPTDWAGLPAEPEKLETEAERLQDAATPGLSDLLGGGTLGTIEINIPVEPAPHDPRTNHPGTNGPRTNNPSTHDPSTA